MALSGRILGSFGGANTSHVRPVIIWSATQSVSGNYSTVTASLVFEKYRTDLWKSYNRNGHSVTFTINGNKSTSNRTFDIRNTSSQTIWTRTIRVNHSADGTKTFSMSASGSTGVNLGSYNFSGTGELTQIPRASSLTCFTINAHLQPGTANRVNLGISRASGSSFNHDIQLRDGGTVLQSWKNQGVPSTLTIDSSTVNTLLKRMSSNTTRTLTLRVQTKSGSTNVGSALTRTATATVNSNVRPTATGLSVSINGSGRDSSRKIYVQGVSRASVKVNSSATGGASITSRRIVVRHNGTKGNVSTITSGSGTSGILTQSGTYEVIATVTDSRGRTNTQTRTTFTVEAYSPPRITTFSAVRNTGTPTTVNISRVGSFSPIGTGHNTLTISVQRRSGTGSWANVVANVTTTSTTFSGTVNSTGNSVTSSYEFRVVATDQFGGRAEATGTVSTQRVVLDIHKNEGVGIGKIHEDGVLDVDGGAHFKGDLFVNGTNVSRLVSFSSAEGIPTPIEDTTTFWQTLPQGSYFVNQGNIPSQPSNWGIMVHTTQNTGVDSDFNTMWYSQSSGAIYRKSGNRNVNNDWVLVDRPERGSNSNGQWVRFNDGTMICTREVTLNLATGAYQSFGLPSSYDTSFPISISLSAKINSTLSLSNAIALSGTTGHPVDNSTIRVRVSANHVSGTMPIVIMTIGRWR